MRDSIALLRGESRAKFELLTPDLEGRVTRLENNRLNAKESIQARNEAVANRNRLIRQQAEQLHCATQIARDNGSTRAQA